MSSIRGIDAFADGPMMMMMSASSSAPAPPTASAADASISYPHHQYEDRWRQHQAVATAAQSQRRQSRTDCRSERADMTACYSSYELVPPSAAPAAAITATATMVQQQQHHQTQTTIGGRTPAPPSALVQQTTPVVQKDYSLPLHVDCSVEYELPNQAKPPAGVRNEPLLMIHPCYFRKIESQRRSPFINNLPTKQTPASKRRMAKIQQINNQLQQHLQQQQQQIPQPAVAQFPMHPQRPQQQQMWEPMPPLVPISAAAAAQQSCCKRDVSGCNAYSSGSADSGHWTDPDRSPDRPDNKHIFSGKYRQYLRAHRLQPYVTSEFPIASTFPQIQQVCYNV